MQAMAHLEQRQALEKKKEVETLPPGLRRIMLVFKEYSSKFRNRKKLEGLGRKIRMRGTNLDLFIST